MRRLKALLASVVLGICLHLNTGGVPLVAQEPCPPGEIVININSATNAQATGSGCGSYAAPENDRSVEPAVVELGSDIDLNLSFGPPRGDGSMSVSGVLPEVSGAFLAVIDLVRRTYRSFDLGGLNERANTAANVARVHQWVQAAFTGVDVAPPILVSALLADVDADKSALLATGMRNTYAAADPETQQQGICTQWVNFKLRTTDVVGIAMVDTRNDTLVNLIDGHPYMSIGAICHAHSPTAAGTDWYTSACRAHPVFFVGRSYSRVYHRAWNTNFLGGVLGTHTASHWIWDNFDHIAKRQWATYTTDYTGTVSGTFATVVLDRRAGDNC